MSLVALTYPERPNEIKVAHVIAIKLPGLDPANVGET